MAEIDELASRIEQAAASVDGVERVADASGIRYLLGETEFAVVASGRAAFRLRPDVADAALRTPGVRTVDRGPGWVELAPGTLDRFAIDRATSWFAAAARFAAEGDPRRRH